VTSNVEQPVASRKPRSRTLRVLFLILGLLCLALLPLSFLPGIPTFDLVILAAFFFSMSSDRMYAWIMNHRVYGKMVRDYRSSGLTMRMKWIAAVAITASLSLSAFVLVDMLWLRLVLIAVGMYAVWFVFTRPTRVIEPTHD
jgi:uncharacterized protein